LYKEVIKFYKDEIVQTTCGKIDNKMNFYSSLVLIIVILVLVLIESQITVGWKREAVKA